MTIAYYCVLIAAFLPVLLTGLAKFSGPGFRNDTPRRFQDTLQGMRQRLHWAHLNSFEAFPPFAAAVIIGHLTNVPQTTLDKLAMTFIGLRLIYGAMYALNWPALRSVVWAGAVASWVAIFFLAPK
jgi:uncharacterized MAPEG superfamily protein